jgi:cell division protein FtsL
MDYQEEARRANEQLDRLHQRYLKLEAENEQLKDQNRILLAAVTKLKLKTADERIRRVQNESPNDDPGSIRPGHE